MDIVRFSYFYNNISNSNNYTTQRYTYAILIKNNTNFHH